MKNHVTLRLSSSQAAFLIPAILLSHSLVYAQSSSTVTSTSTTSPSESTPTNSEVACSLEEVYMQPNASNSYPISAIVQQLSPTSDSYSSTIMDSTSEQWQVINALGQTVDPYSQDGTQEVEQLLLLDTARSQPNPPAIPSPLAGCSFVFSLPQSDNGKTEDRTCASFLTATCVNDIRFQAQKLALIIANAENVTLEDACKGMSTNLAILPESCPKASSGSTAGFSVIESSGINLTYSVADECSGGPKNIPIPIYQQTADIQGNDDSIYNQWAMTITPLLLAFFSNATFYAGSAFADTQLVCTTPRNIAAGSAPPRPPTKNAADPGTMVDMNSVLAAFFVLNALFFLVL